MHPVRKRNRLAGYDYSRPNFYFVSPIVKGRYHYFGEIQLGRMILSQFGEIANDQFRWLKNQYPYINIPIWVIMPDHVHAIIQIQDIVPAIDDRMVGRVWSRPDPTDHTIIDNGTINDDGSRKIKSLSSLMGAYKTTTSKLIHLAGLTEFRWQRSFHDRIIRNRREYWNIYRYIKNNPVNWGNDDNENRNPIV
jgi:REP element-mobilizing transposase RayT